MKLYCKATRDKYKLPVAVADSIPELAKMTGNSENTIRSSISRCSNTFYVVEVPPEMWPDNDGNLWYYDNNGGVVTVEG